MQQEPQSREEKRRLFQHSQTSTESLASVFSQALSIISKTSSGGTHGSHQQGLGHHGDSNLSLESLSQKPATTKKRKKRKRFKSRAEEDVARKEREERSIAIEKAYVHDVYEQISQHISERSFRAWPRVKQFLEDLETGSLVCDVGCGSGKYLNVNPSVFNIGSDRCQAMAHIARKKEFEILHCDNLYLPFRDCSLDAVLSVAVIHHVATVERRVRAIKELARVLRVGGKVIISVWAMEQRHRKFESQDVLIPWHRPSVPTSSSKSCKYPSSGSNSNPVPTLNRQSQPDASSLSSFMDKDGKLSDRSVAATTTHTTTTTSEDDVTHYHAYTQTSDSSTAADQGIGRINLKRRGRPRTKGRSIDPLALESGLQHCQSSSDLSSPNETCYSFVRRALQKFSPHKRQINDLSSEGVPRFPWFLGFPMTRSDPFFSVSLPQIPLKSAKEVEESGNSHPGSKKQSMLFEEIWGDSEESGESPGEIPIELRHLEGELDDYMEMEMLDSHGEEEEQIPERSNGDREGVGKDLNDYLYFPSFNLATNILSLFGQLDTKSRSLNDLSGSTDNYDDPNVLRKQKLGNVGRANTYDEGSCHQRGDSEVLVGKYEDSKNSRSSLTTDVPFAATGSVSSISSAKSVTSTCSAKSDIVASTSGDKVLASRSWESEPHLDSSKRRGSTGTGRATKTKEHSSCSSTKSLSRLTSIGGEKEKSKAMLSVESKLMKVIKEVNENEISEGNTPLPSPISPIQTHSQELHDKKPNANPSVEDAKQESSSKDNNDGLKTRPPRPVLVKQKQSFQYLDDTQPASSSEHISKSSDESERASTEKKSASGDKNSSGGSELFSLISPVEKKLSILKQLSLNDELLFRERQKENMEMRQKVQKQHSLPCDDRKSWVKGGLLAKIRKFESLNVGLSFLRSRNFLGVQDIQNQEEKGCKETGIKAIPCDQDQPEEGTCLGEGLVKILQKSFSVQTNDDAPSEYGSFTHKKGVDIEPLEMKEKPLEGAANRRNVFQRRRGGSSPKSPQQIMSLTKDNLENISPTLRRCCMDCPSGDLVLVERERKLSRGEASDSSSKDGSIQSDTSLDSEDSCVSVIFVPHPEGKFGTEGITTTDAMIIKKQRSTSNSSESSDSIHSTGGSGRGSPMSPSNRLGSPVKGNGKAVKKFEILRQVGVPFEGKIIGRIEDCSQADTAVVYVERALEKIEERHTESEMSEEEEKEEEKPKVSTKDAECPPDTCKIPSSTFSSPKGPKSFEMEDLPDENPILCHPSGKACIDLPHSNSSRSRTSRRERRTKFEYPIVRHHPLFAKQDRPGQRSNFSSLLLGENVRVIRKGSFLTRSLTEPEQEPDNCKGERKSAKYRSFEIFNPETDDLDSDNESNTGLSDSDDDSSADSIESVVSAIKDEPRPDPLDGEGKGPLYPPTVIVTEAENHHNNNSNNITDEENYEKQATPNQTEEPSVALDEVAKPAEEAAIEEVVSEMHEFSKRAEERRKVLQFLLDENESVLTSISGSTYRKVKLPTVAPSATKNEVKLPKDSDTSLESDSNVDVTPSPDLPPQPNPISKSAIPGILSVPTSKPQRRKLDKARSVSPSTCSRQQVTRQSSVPTKFDEVHVRPTTEMEIRMRKTVISNRNSSLADLEDQRKGHLDIFSTPSDPSSNVPSSRESLTSSTEETSSFPPTKSKSPSPSRSETSTPSSQDGSKRQSVKRTSPRVANVLEDSSFTLKPSSSASVPFGGARRKIPMLTKTASAERQLVKEPNMEDLALTQSLLPTTDEHSGELPEYDVGKLTELDPRFDRSSSHHPPPVGSVSTLQNDVENSCGFPYKRLDKKPRPGREDSLESSSASAKSSVQYSDTSSLLSHRFSTISISSNVSSEVSFGNASAVSGGSSNYLASMSSADYDDRPVLASSLSLSEADETEFRTSTHELIGGVSNLTPRTPHEKSRMRSLFRRSVGGGKGDVKVDNEPEGPGSGLEEARSPRSRIGTETSLETSIDIQTCIDRSSFEEELFIGMSRDDDQGRLTPSESKKGSKRPSASSSKEESSEDGGSLTHHRYYHVFKEGELDYLINNYVDNLHIIHSYYDHANWCIVAEKVNVWTI